MARVKLAAEQMETLMPSLYWQYLFASGPRHRRAGLAKKRQTSFWGRIEVRPMK
jgi:hypothetical protein